MIVRNNGLVFCPNCNILGEFKKILVFFLIIPFNNHCHQFLAQTFLLLLHLSWSFIIYFLPSWMLADTRKPRCKERLGTCQRLCWGNNKLLISCIPIGSQRRELNLVVKKGKKEGLKEFSALITPALVELVLVKGYMSSGLFVLSSRWSFDNVINWFKPWNVQHCRHSGRIKNE